MGEIRVIVIDLAMMLRNRSRAVLGKQSLVADHPRSAQPSPTQNHRRNRVSSFFGSAFGGLSPSRFRCDTTKPMMSPSLILDVSPFSALRTRLPDRPSGGKKRSWEELESQEIGLAIVDRLFDKVPDKNRAKPNRNLVLYGSSMRVRIPSPPAPTPGPLECPTDFGIKTRNSQLSSPNSQARASNSPRLLTGCLSVSEMELSEDYTCVTYHGPNARTTHIFDNCIVESYFTVLPDKPKPGKQSFLNSCYTCKKSLEQTKDIYIYRYDLFISSILHETEMPKEREREREAIFHWVLGIV